MEALARDIVTLGKPKIIVLLAITCLCGSLVAAKGNADLLLPVPVLAGLLGLIISAAGGNTINMWWDRDIDALMKRTQQRPLPTGRRSPAFVLGLGIFEIVLGFGVAAYGANLLTGLMALSGALFYVFVYTMLLKRRTVQNIVIGGAAGAFPPLVGWAAVQGDISHPLPWLMFAIIFLWTPPHFWALALLSNSDYRKAKVPMYPVVHGEALTRVAILRYLLLLLPVTLAPALCNPLGWLYLLMATALGAWWSLSAWHLFKSPADTAHSPAAARIVFKRSLYYLALVFAAMVVDAWL
ncbi:MAG TPA: heme o synthase [Alphaproteobacteria bacterium]|nr:heme o synthase [Alphaproteobacteria bacterium]